VAPERLGHSGLYPPALLPGKHPAREVGGDLYDFDWNSEALQLVIGDVSGKSIPAALYGAVFSGQVQMLFSHSLSPAQALAILNKNLLARYRSGNYISVAYCRLELRNGSVILANGGMPSPFVVRGTRIMPLQVSGVPLGLMEGISHEEFRLQLEPGDTLILLTDGVTDALNPQGDFYDLDRFSDSAARHSAEGIAEYLASLHSELRMFIGSAELSDDVTIIGLRRLK
jgi:sigma-B regulation protein RsbU (phosphoserine phosphatase)